MPRQSAGFVFPVRVLLLLLAAALSCSAATLDTGFSTEEKRSLQREALLIIEILQGYHYSDRPFHELDSRELLDGYLKALDPYHLLFTAEDVDFIHRRFERNLKSVYLFKGDLFPAFEIYDLFSTRALARFDWIDRQLQRPPDLSRAETLSTNRQDSPWPNGAKEADALWTQWLKSELIAELLQGRDAESAGALIRQRYAEDRRHIEETDPLTVRERFLTTLLELFDPHSGYFSRDAAGEFEIEMSGSVVGIGVDMRAVQGHFVVESLQPGGPAERDGRIFPGDQILAVTEAGGKTVEITGRRLRDVVQLTRGQAGSKVTLTVRPDGTGESKVVTLERSRMEIAINHARGAVFSVPSREQFVSVGVVFLPAFYGEANAETKSASMARDVRELLENFSRQQVKGVVIDLSNNGGGLLKEAVKLAGLFIREGPVLLIRGLDGKVQILRVDDPAVAYSGPLVVMTSHNSASASEAFAGAMKYCRRAIVVGASSTYGKGTAQDYMDLRTLMPGISSAQKKDWGTLRITRQCFYLPDGNTPQQKGIPSDIQLPTFDPPGFIAEKDRPHALPWKTISAVETNPAAIESLNLVTDELRQHLQETSRERVDRLPEFELKKRVIAFYERYWKQDACSLQLDTRKGERAAMNQSLLELRQQRQELGARLAYACTRIDVAAVSENNRANQSSLRSRMLPDGTPCVNRFYWNVYYYETSPGGTIRTIPVDKLDLDACAADAASLAEVWTKATSWPIANDRVTSILADLKLRRDSAGATAGVPGIFRKHAGGKIDQRTLAKGLDAFFRKAIEIDGDMLHDLPVLDVNLRESLRIAADWALNISPGIESPPPAAPPSPVPVSPP